MFNKVKITELVRFDWFIKYMFRDKSDFEILEGFLSGSWRALWRAK